MEFYSFYVYFRVVVISFFKCFERWRVGGVSGWYVGVVFRGGMSGRVGPNPKSCFEWPRTNVMGAGGHPEHFEPKQRSVAAIAINRTASKVLASQY